MSAAPETRADDQAETPTTSQARRDACRANSLLSTGPKDCAETRRNAYDHGLTATIALPPEELRLIGLRFEAYKESFRPATPYQLDKCEQAAHGAHRAKRAQIFQAKARRRLETRTRAEFDEDRRGAIRDLAATLARRPERVAAELAGSAPGCHYLLERWGVLTKRLGPDGRWTAERLSEAYDLLGVSKADRLGDTALPLGDREGMLRRIAEEVQGLEARLAGGLAAREGRLYEESREGMGLEEEPEIKLYRRYEREALRHERRAVAELLADQERQKAAAAAAMAEPPTPPIVEAPPAPVAEAAAPAVEPAPAPIPNPSTPTPTTPAGPRLSASGLVEGPDGPMSLPNPR